MYQVSLSAPSFLSPSHSTQSTTPYSLEQALIILLPSPGLAWPLQSLLLLISSPGPSLTTSLLCCALLPSAVSSQPQQFSTRTRQIQLIRSQDKTSRLGVELSMSGEERYLVRSSEESLGTDSHIVTITSTPHLLRGHSARQIFTFQQNLQPSPHDLDFNIFHHSKLLVLPGASWRLNFVSHKENINQ